MRIIRLGLKDREFCLQAANLHIRGIRHGLLPLLGNRFLTNMYSCIAVAPKAGVWAIVDGDKLIGFISGCASVRRTYLWLMVNCSFSLLIAAGLALFRLDVLKKLHSIFLYPFLHRNEQLENTIHESELLAIAIDEAYHGKGYGKQLVHVFESSLIIWGVREYQVLTNISDSNSNAFYRAIGFTTSGTIKHHSLILQVYIKKIIQKDTE